jgi:hypothetical protein
MFKQIGDNTLIIMIDTNVYCGEDTICYNSRLNVNALKDMQIRKIKNKFEEYKLKDIIFKNIIVCGHNPLIGFKNQQMKDGKVKGGLDVCGPKLYELLFSLKEYGRQFYYLCADIHNYQKGVVGYGI